MAYATLVLFDDAHLDLHAAERRGRTDERAPQRQRVPLVPRHRHANQVAIPDDAVGGIEVDPARSRQVRLHPGMRRSAADRGVARSPRHEDVAADEARGEAERSNGLHHEHREVPAAAAAAPQRLARALHALFPPPQVPRTLP